MPKPIIAAAFAVSLLCGTSALAQPNDHHGGGQGGGDHDGGGQGGGGQPQAGGASRGGGQGNDYAAPPRAYLQGQPAPHGGEQGHGPVAPSQTFGGGDHGGHGDQGGRGWTGDHGWNGDHGDHGDHGWSGDRGDRGDHGWNGDRGGRPRYNDHDYPHAFGDGRHYRWHGDWNRPHDYYYRRWGYGDYLPRGWFAPSFWIDDFWFYDLPEAPYGYAWVREGPDAVLVNLYNGMVVEVDYDVFY